jgi:fatty acid desaturase
MPTSAPALHALMTVSTKIRLSRVSLIAAIATGAAAGGLTGQALSDPDTMSTVVSLRKACYILSLSESAHCVRPLLLGIFERSWTLHSSISISISMSMSRVVVVVAVMLGLHVHSVFLGHAKIGWGISCSALVYTAVLVVIAVYRLVSRRFLVPLVPKRV